MGIVVILMDTYSLSSMFVLISIYLSISYLSIFISIIQSITYISIYHLTNFMSSPENISLSSICSVKAFFVDFDFDSIEKKTKSVFFKYRQQHKPLSIYVYVFIYQSIYLYIYLFINLSICLFIFMEFYKKNKKCFLTVLILQDTEFPINNARSNNF